MVELKIQNALVLSKRPLGEKSYILSLFTPQNGRHLGVIHRKSPPDIGSFINTRWQARLFEQIGTYYIEDIAVFAVNFIEDRQRLACLLCVCALLDKLLAERQNHALLYQQTIKFLYNLNTDDFIENYIHWEINLLTALGFGLDFSKCAGGGDAQDLYYVSPKSGCAVSREKGEPYRGKLLILPPFLWKKEKASPIDLKQGLILTGYFLQNHTGLPYLPTLREQLFTKIER